MNLGDLRTTALAYLGTASDDPGYPTTTLNLLVQQAYDQVMGEIVAASPMYLNATANLVPDDPTVGIYSLATQSTPITNFRAWLEVRWESATGPLLRECRIEELTTYGQYYFAVTGTDETAVFTLSTESSVANPLWLRYAYWPATLSVDTDSPVGVPSRYHDLIALRTAALAFALGGESSFPPVLAGIMQDRFAALMQDVSRRGVAPALTRLDPATGTGWGWGQNLNGWGF